VRTLPVLLGRETALALAAAVLTVGVGAAGVGIVGGEFFGLFWCPGALTEGACDVERHVKGRALCTLRNALKLSRAIGSCLVREVCGFHLVAPFS